MKRHGVSFSSLDFGKKIECVGDALANAFLAHAFYPTDEDKIYFIRNNITIYSEKREIQDLLAHELLHVAQFRNFPEIKRKVEYLMIKRMYVSDKELEKEYQSYISLIEGDAERTTSELFPADWMSGKTCSGPLPSLSSLIGTTMLWLPTELAKWAMGKKGLKYPYNHGKKRLKELTWDIPVSERRSYINSLYEKSPKEIVELFN